MDRWHVPRAAHAALLVMVLFLAVASSDAVGNLAFDSPYTNVPGLEIRVPPKARWAERESNKPAFSIAQFDHGVASGDPLEDRIILWTKVTPDKTEAAVPVAWEVARDREFANIVSSGTAITTREVDFTVKVDAQGLEPRTSYFYRFIVNGASKTTSPIGQTKTMPQASDSDAVDKLVFAAVTCANMPHGYFHAYSRIAERNEVDVVIGLGDQIYEYDLASYKPVGGGLPADRNPVPNKVIVTLADYRARHAQYKRDVDQMRLGARHPWIMIWDDHEFADNTWKGGAPDHHTGRDGPWSDRKLAGARAFHEYNPVRPSKAAGDPYRVYRSFKLGNLVDLIMLDTRLEGRDEQIKGDRAQRRIMSDEQEAWLHTSLVQSKAAWRIIGNQVMFAKLPQKFWKWEWYPPSDSWVGYPRSRDRLMQLFKDHRINSTAMLTGDFHGSQAADIFHSSSEYNKKTGAGSLFTEFVGPSLTSASPARDSSFLNWFVRKGFYWINSGAKFVDMYRHGYMLVTVTPDKLRTEYYYVNSIKERNGGGESMASQLETMAGANRMTLTNIF